MRRAARSAIVTATALASLALTALAWQAAREQAEREDRLRFELRVEEIATALRGRLLDYEQVLRGAVALFAASQKVEREEWAAYVRALDTANSYPGIQAIGYGRAHREGGALRVPVTYIEPTDSENARVVGLDMYADSSRRVAMDRARDAAEPVLTGPLQLLQDRGGAPRAGAVLFLPVFRGAELDGFVYGAFRIRELLERTVGAPPGIHLRLIDVSDLNAPALLYEADEAFTAPARFQLTEPLIVRGRTWRLEAAAAPWFGAASDRPHLVLAGGAAISLLLTILTWSLLNTTAHARELARRMTATSEELRRFRTAVDSHRDTMLLVDADKMRIVYVNEGACRNLGYRREELVGQSPEIVFADRDAARLVREYRELGETSGEIYRALHRRKDGTVYSVEISRELVKGASGTFIFGVARDVSSRLETERRLALALESSGLALFDWDLRTGLVHMGAQWGEILGGAPAASVTPIQKLDRLVHPDDQPSLREQLRLLVKGDIERYRVEHRVRNTRGDWVWIESVAEVSERDGDGRALRITGTNADITARKALGELKNAFIANVSHELRTPLTGVVASLELLKEGAGGELPDQARKFVDMAHGNSERLNELIGDLLDLERVESGRLHLELEPLDVAEILEEAAALNGPYVARYRARLRTDADGAARVTADRKRLLQVITNLVSNAAKFSPQDGEILVSARAHEHRVLFSVSDQGPGVPPEFQPRMFDKFEQAKHSKGGTGLGLAICKSLVERMGGRIWCESGPGRGTTMLVELPAAG